MHPFCPVCGEKKKNPCAYGGYIFQGIPMPLVHCRGCGLKYIDYQLSDDLRAALYNEHTYFESAYAGGGGKGTYVENKVRQEQKAQRALRSIMRFKKKGSLFEIGCAGGYFLQLAQKQGYTVSGVEVSEEMAAYAREQGLDVITGELHDVPKKKSFDIVYLGDVLEHVNDPFIFLGEIIERVNKNGLIAIEVPLSYNLTLVGLVIGCMQAAQGRFGYKYFLPPQHRGKLLHEKPYHLSFFNHASLSTLLSRAGLITEYLSIYEGEPKQKFSGTVYFFLKNIVSHLPRWIGLNYFGDRAFVIARKK